MLITNQLLYQLSYNGLPRQDPEEQQGARLYSSIPGVSSGANLDFDGVVKHNGGAYDGP
jgi:hypothetical protein